MAHTFTAGARYPTSTTSVLTSNPLASAFTCGAGDTVLVLMLSYAAVVARTGGSPTYGGSPLALASGRIGVTECSCEAWYMLNPPTGTSLTVSVPNANTRSMGMVIASAKAGAGKVSAYNGAGTRATTASNPYAAVDSVSGGIVFAVVSSGLNLFNPTVRTGTNISQGDVGLWGYGAQYLIETASGTRTMSWTANSDDYGAIALSFIEADPPSTTNILMNVISTA